MSSSRPCIGVVGAGIVGLATAHALIEKGADVTCFEQSAPGSGQSGGLTRVFRHTHATEAQVRFAKRARDEWRRWEQRFGQTLIGSEGVVVTGEQVPVVAAMFDAIGLPHRTGDDSLSEILPIARSDRLPYLLDEEAGAIRAARSITCLQEVLGQRLVRGTAFGLAFDGGAILETDVGEWKGDHVVVCAGAQTVSLADGCDLQIPDHRELHPQAYFRIRPEFATSVLPCLLERSGHYARTVYASPVGRTGMYSVGLSSGVTALPMDRGGLTVPDESGLQAIRSEIVRYVEAALPGLDPAPEVHRTCIVTTLDDDDDDAFAAWQRGPATFFAGHNVFKLAPLIGQLLAEAALGEAMPDELRPRSDQ